MPTYDEIAERISYDPESGHFFQKEVKFSNRPVGSRIGCLHKTKGYRYLSFKNTTLREQRVAFLLMTGSWPEGQVDHINRIKDDNRWINLRDVSPSENCQNRGKFKTNRSGYKGVVWQKYSEKWQVLCRREGVQYYLGLFENLEDAAGVANTFYQGN